VLVETKPDLVFQEGAVIALAGRRSVILEREPSLGKEVDDRELLDFELTVLDAVVTNKQLAGKTLGELVARDLSEVGRGVFARKILRSGVQLPLTAGLRIDRGDTLTLVGAKPDVERAAAAFGYVDRPTEETDMVVMGLGITAGALVGAITIYFGGIPLSLSTSGGALVAGLVCGWLRSMKPGLFGRVPGPTLWIFESIGLAGFVAVVGLNAGPDFVQGLRTSGPSLVLAGVLTISIPLLVGVLVGRWVFKMHPGVLLERSRGGALSLSLRRPCC
jgi:putative transport protein